MAIGEKPLRNYLKGWGGGRQRINSIGVRKLLNEQNLKRPTAEEAREKGRLGGKASGEARRRRKALKENMEILLNMPPGDKDKDALVQAGFNENEIDNSQLLVLGLFTRAKMGDVQAFKELRALIGEDGESSVSFKIVHAVPRPDKEDG